ncbi:MAG: septum site-determining protein MinC [Rubrivivax sp.]|nr:MAG: septum site-determining protein MinC [Rubrivivax sp.]
MPAPSSGNTPALFDLKSASMTMVAVLLRTADLDALAQALMQRLGGTPDFFNLDPVVIDISALSADGTPIDFTRLVNLLRSFRMIPVAVRGGSPAQMDAALDAGLGEAPEAASAGPRKAEPVVQTVEVVKEVIREVQVPVPVEVPGAAVPTLVIDKPLRSGQQVYAKGGDLIVLAAVNNGAEVIADGHIHIYAPLRGKAIAGAKGNAQARIFAACMEPELISIAGTYRTTDNPLPADVVGKAAQIRLDGERLVYEPIKF